MARIIVATANKQSADTARRVKRKHAKMQQEGLPTGGPRPFGWNDDRRTLRQVEADAIKTGVGRLLEKVPLTAVFAAWNDQGILTPRGNRWVKNTVLQMLRNPRLCGLRGRTVNEVDPDTQRVNTHYEIVLDAKTGKQVVGQWEPVVTVDEWERLMVILGSRKLASRGHNTRKYLLSGILRCGADGCGTKMAGGARSGTDTFRYYCPGVNQGGCGKVAIAGELTDAYLTEAILAKLELEAKRRDAQAPVSVWAREQDLTDVREQIADLTRAWRDKGIKAARYFALLADLEQDESDLETERTAWLTRVAIDVPTPLDIRREWPDKTLAEQRAYAQRVLTAVIVKPAEGARRFNPDRLVPVWTQTPDD